MKKMTVLTIRKKLLVASGVSALIVLLACFMGLRGMSGIRQAQVAVATLDEVHGQLVQRELDHFKWVQKAGLFLGDATITRIEVQKDPHLCNLGKWFYGDGRRKLEGLQPDLVPLIARLEEPHAKLHQSIIAVEDHLVKGAGSRPAAVSMFKEQTAEHLRTVQGLLGDLEKELETKVGGIRTQSAMQAASARNRMLIGTGFFVGLILLVGLLTANTITRPIRGVIQTLEEIAHGQGNLTKRIPMPRFNCSAIKNCGNNACPEFGKEASCWDTVGSNAPGDIHCPAILKGKFKSCHECQVMQTAMATELDELAGWFNTFIGTVSHIIREVQENTATLRVSAGEMSGASSTLRDNFEGITAQAVTVSSTTEEMSANIDVLASASEEMSVNAGNVASAAGQMSQNMETVSAAIEEMTTSINKIADNAREAEGVAGSANDMANTARGTMGRLGAAAQEIGKVTGVIKRIAEQTNLLALNATIEAASAGEAGKGFAVVANEIKELANQSAQAASDIAQRIEGMQNNATDAVTVIGEVSGIMGKISKAVRVITQSVEQQMRVANDISTNALHASAGTNDIARAISEVASGSTDMSRNIGEMAKGVHDVAASIGEVSRSVNDSGDTVLQVNSSAGSLAAMAAKQSELLGRFVV